MEKIIDFLIKNGYQEETENKDNDFRSFYKAGVSSIDLCSTEIVLVGDEGDWLHLPVNYYALIGALLHFRQLACDYKC